MSPLRGALERLRPARGDAARDRLALTAAYGRRQRIEALRGWLRDAERARRAREDAPEGDDRLLYLRVQSALRRFEREERLALVREERARPRIGKPLGNAASQLAALLRPAPTENPAYS